MVKVGNTPMLSIDGVYTKLECTNPCGSIKDRIATYILDESTKRGLLREGDRIVEASSGNTGIALSYFGRARGHEVTIVMPENMTAERKEIITRLGATLVSVSEKGSFAEAAAVRDELASKPGHFNPDQFSNPLNVECHRVTTGAEILRQIAEHTDASIDAFVSGVGTGGTLMGVGAAIREAFPNAKLVAVEPAESAVMSGGEPASHGIYGIGDGFIPEIVSDGNGGVSPEVDEVICIESGAAKNAAHYLSAAFACCVGISSGANFLAAQRIKERFETVVTIFPDGYQKYRSEGLVRCRGDCPFEHDLLV
ncbi:MAG TPA: cysteine synthase family protein [Vicinamibacteria bacterium]|nr:cysteine synthase family protein [Vicinamibacteria bacterium]